MVAQKVAYVFKQGKMKQNCWLKALAKGAKLEWKSK